MTGAQRVARRRAALRAQGLRPKTVWVPDTSTPEFMDQAHKACDRLWKLSADEAEMIAFAEAMTDAARADLPPPWNDDG